MNPFWIGSNLFALLPSALTAFNLLTWPRGRRDAHPAIRPSVLIPARDEEQNIEACVRAVLASDTEPHEVIVYDDQSSDRTAEIVERLCRHHPRLRLIRGGPLPGGRVGKPHACHQLALASSGEVLLFVDADTVLEPGGVRRLLSLLEPAGGPGADLVTAVPRQQMRGALERLLMPLLTLTYTGWLPLWLVRHSRDPRFLAANGQLLMIRRQVYDRTGGFAAVEREIVDDMALCRLAKMRGARVLFADGFEMASCRMYRSAGELWQGFTKNIYEGLGESRAALLLALVLYATAFVWPYLALGYALAFAPAWLWPPAVGVGANLATRAALALRFRHPASSLLLHPLAVLLLMALAVNSLLGNLRGEVFWRGRSYAARRDRMAV
jgi:chlorobactene glucosyltransferase